MRMQPGHSPARRLRRWLQPDYWLPRLPQTLQAHALFHCIDFLKHRLPDSPASNRLLAIVYGGLGDSLLCEALFAHLKHQQPNRSVDVICGDFSPLFVDMPSVDTVMVARTEHVLGSTIQPAKLRRLVETLHGRGYAESVEVLAMIPIDGLSTLMTGAITWAAGARVRIGRRGMGKRMARRNEERDAWELRPVRHTSRIRTHLFVPGPPSTRTKHESLISRHGLGKDVAPMVGHPQLAAPKGVASLWAEAVVQRLADNERRPVVGVNLEASYTLKAWPVERFLSVMDWGVARGLSFVIIGARPQLTPDSLARRFGDHVLDLSGRTGLPELMALTAHCHAFLSVDSGPAHLAQAYQVPTVVLFGPSNENEFGPRNPMHTAIVAERPCRRPPCVMGPCSENATCMRLIHTDAAIAALDRAVDQIEPTTDRLARLPAPTPTEMVTII